MKRIYSFILILFSSLTIHAVTHTITVSDFQFSPSIPPNVIVGDTVRWVWSSGNHTTTSTQVPAGAATWNNPINQNSTSFIYPVTVEGNYSFQCNFHSSTMTGQFTAINTGISTPNNFSNFDFYSTRSSTYILSYTLVHPSDIKISLFDLTGRSVRVLNSSSQMAGNYLFTYSFEDLQKGIYLFEMFIGNHRITKRLIID